MFYISSSDSEFQLCQQIDVCFLIPGSSVNCYLTAGILRCCLPEDIYFKIYVVQFTVLLFQCLNQLPDIVRFFSFFVSNADQREGLQTNFMTYFLILFFPWISPLACLVQSSLRKREVCLFFSQAVRMAAVKTIAFNSKQKPRESFPLTFELIRFHSFSFSSILLKQTVKIKLKSKTAHNQ